MINKKDFIDKEFLRNTRININEKAKYIKKLMVEKQEIDLYNLLLTIRRPKNKSGRIMIEVISAKFFKIRFSQFF